MSKQVIRAKEGRSGRRAIGAVALLCLLGAPVFGQGTWVIKAPMPTARSAVAASAVDGILYAMGGCNASGNPVAVVEAYDPKTDTWITKSPMPAARCAVAASVINGLIYVVGGFRRVGQIGFAQELATLEVYDPKGDTWSVKAPMPTPRAALAAGVVGGVLYVVGGEGYQSGVLPTVEAYDPISNAWVRKAPMPTPRAGLVASSINGKLYVTGKTEPRFQPTLEVYNPITNSWTLETSMPTPRFGAASGVIEAEFYVVGGIGQDGNASRSVEAFDLHSHIWSARAPLPTARLGLGAAVIEDILYAIGGEVRRNPVRANEAFSPFLPISIDIKPGDANNMLNLKSNGTVAVAILSTAEFGATTVDPATVKLAGAPVATQGRGIPMTSVADLNRAGRLDLLLHFRTQDLQLTPTSTEAVLKGKTFSGQLIRGVDSIRLVP